jgi:hypothetical protein
MPDQDTPFIGLRPFQSDESLYFFGRREQTAELLARLHDTRFLAVIGSSGCGKSSLVRAGLIPNLKAGFLVEDRDRWIVSVMTPSDVPLYNLAACVKSAAPDGGGTGILAFREEIRDHGAQALLQRMRPVLGCDTNLLLLVDQFEELIRYGVRANKPANRDEAADFASILLSLSQQREIPVYVVITMRSDFLGDCDAFHGLPEALNRSSYLVPRLTREQRRMAVEGPVRLFGETIAPQLVDRVLNDCGEESDQLPIMQHVMLRTWEEWRKNGAGGITIESYRSAGTAKEALSRDAQAVLDDMPEPDRLLAQRIFRALTDTDAANRRIRRPARVSELGRITGADPAGIMAVVEAFHAKRRWFMVATGAQSDPLIDISHESLIRHWDTLAAWLRMKRISAHSTGGCLTMPGSTRPAHATSGEIPSWNWLCVGAASGSRMKPGLGAMAISPPPWSFSTRARKSETRRARRQKRRAGVSGKQRSCSPPH